MKKMFAMLLTVCLLLAGCAPAQPGVDDGEKLPVDEAAQQEIRRALGMLIDRNYIAGSIGQAGQVPADGFVPMGMDSYYRGGYYAVDPDRYTQTFREAITILRKYYRYDEKTGKFLDFPTLTYLYNTAESHKAVGEYLQAVFAGVGTPL